MDCGEQFLREGKSSPPENQMKKLSVLRLYLCKNLFSKCVPIAINKEYLNIHERENGFVPVGSAGLKK